MHDWLIFLLLIAIDIGLNVIEPFHRFVGDLTDISYPMKDNTIPTWSVPLYAVLLPIIIFVAFYFKRKDVYDLHHAILGILYAVLITGVFTDAIKNGVGRPRPDFRWRCFKDGKPVIDNTIGNVVCNGLKSDIKEGHKSFPSGHASWSFAGLGFLSWYLAGKIRAFDRRGHVAKLCIVFAPLLAACLVAVSRVDDYRHHWQDVFAGGILGLVVSSFCYLQFFPPPYHVNGWSPHAYFSALGIDENVQPPMVAVNSLNTRQNEQQAYDSSQNGDGSTDRRRNADDIELGRRD